MSRPLIQLTPEMVTRFWTLTEKSEPDNCWNWKGSCHKNGYGRFNIEQYIHEAHIVAFRIANNIDPRGTVIRHSCDNRRCCNPKHLIDGTHADNTQDKMNRGRHRFKSNWEGVNNPNAKLTDEEIDEIRKIAILLPKSDILKLPQFKGRISISGLKDILNLKTRNRSL